MAATKKKKKGPGRPPGSKNKTTKTTTKVEEKKRGPGRSPGSKNKGPGRPKGSKNSTTKTPAKTSTKKNVKEVKNPKSTRGGATREINEDTGFSVGTDSDKIAQALLKGNSSRKGVIDAMRKKLSDTTRTGTEKPVPNMVAGVLNKMLDQGYRLEESFILLPPTPASKRAASKRRNAK